MWDATDAHATTGNANVHVNFLCERAWPAAHGLVYHADLYAALAACVADAARVCATAAATADAADVGMAMWFTIACHIPVHAVHWRYV